MNRFVCCIILLISCSAVLSQKVYFIYLQSEAGQPFFVKINEKTYNSAPTGYLIVPKLKDSSYSLNIGFPQNKWPEQQFLVVIKSEDHGFLLKNFGERGWGLFDLQTMGVQMSADNRTKDKSLKTELREVSAFTAILSKAANDPSLMEKPVFAVTNKEEKIVRIQHAVVKEETTALNDQPIVNPDTTEVFTKKKELPAIVKEEVEKREVSPKAEISAVPVQQYKKSTVIKRSESSTSEGFGLTFVDQYPNGQKDTIHIIVPNPDSVLNNVNNQLDEGKRFIEITEQSKVDSLSAKKKLANNNCSSIASENDFLKLRKKMAGQKSEESMINEAKKAFKAKCYSIEQVKNLGNLFLNEAAKFQFYEAAYPYSNDRNSFTILQSEFKDTYFIHRLNNLVK